MKSCLLKRSRAWKLALAATSLVVVPSLWALDYQAQPLPPKLVQDAATTFLVDLTTAKVRPDYSAGAATLSANPAGFAAGAYRGSLTIPTAKVMDGPAWTLEMILRLPAETAAAKQALAFGGMAVRNNWDFALSINPSTGLNFRLSGPPNTDGRKYEFNFGGFAGGDSYSLHRNAAGKWVYAALGMDLVQRRSSIIVRDMDGKVLDKNACFFRLGNLQENFAAALPADQRAAAENQCWADMLRSYAKGFPPAFSLGSDKVDLRAVRISNRYRPEILLLAPVFEGIEGTPRTAVEIDPARAVKATVQRSVGYNDYNYRMEPVEEDYIPLAPGQKITLPVKDLKVGLYSFWLYGTIDPKGRPAISQVWQPAPMEFEVADAHGKKVGSGRLLLKQSFHPRFMQAFSFHVDEPGDFTATFHMMDRAMETPRITQINFVDVLQGLPDEAVKTARRLEEGKTGQLKTLTLARKERDDAIWNAYPPLNIHTLTQNPPPWRKPPAKFVAPKWAFVGGPPAPLDVINTATKQVLPAAQVIAGAPFPGTPTDDGTGIFLKKSDYPELAQDMYWCPRAELMCERMLAVENLIVSMGNPGKTSPAVRKYLETGDVNAGQDAAMTLIRVAYDLPALEYAVQDIRLCTADPDLEFTQHWSYGRGGKVINWSWSCDHVTAMFEAYDNLFPFIKDNTILAGEVHRFIPWVKTPQDVIKLLDRQLVFAAVRDQRRDFLKWNIEDRAGEVLGPGPMTADLFDLTRQVADLYPFTGTFQDGYATALSRSGSYYIASFLCYALGSAQETVAKAYAMLMLKRSGVQPKMDLSDVNQYPKVRGASNFILDMWVAGGFPFMVGDAGGGPHTGPIAYNRLEKPTLLKAFALCGDPRDAWILENKFGVKDPEVAKAAEGQRDPILFSRSHVVPDYGAILEMNPDEADLTKKTGATLRLGIGQGHAHSDYLDVNFYALGLPLAVDLACRDEGTQTWSRPGASWGFLHNHAFGHDGEDPRKVGGQSGEPWLRAFAPPLARASYVDKSGANRLDRDLLLMPVGDGSVSYAFDVQRVRGGATHTWCFHGCESDDLALNVPMEPKTVRWIDRTLDGAQKAGVASAALQATWTMTRAGRSIPHKFGAGGVIKTAACEPAVMGKLYDANLPPAHIRATLLGHPGEQALQGSPYSENYAYCFPFLWVQGPAKPESVYPAIYEWYRGAEPVVKSAELVSRDPLTVKVVTNSGQTDTFTSATDSFAAVSEDAKGLRWAKVNGLASLERPGLSLKAETAAYHAEIVDVDYTKRTLRTKTPLPANPGVCIGSAGRRSWLDLKGGGTAFSWQDDLLIGGGLITEVKITGPDSLEVKTNAGVLFADSGNRNTTAFTSTNEDGTWQFRDGKVIKKPAGAPLTEKIFTDADGDGLVHLKTYEVGIGDSIDLPADITLRRLADGSYEIQTNVAMTGAVGGVNFQLPAAAGWQKVAPR